NGALASNDANLSAQTSRLRALGSLVRTKKMFSDPNIKQPVESTGWVSLRGWARTFVSCGRAGAEPEQRGFLRRRRHRGSYAACNGHDNAQNKQNGWLGRVPG